MTVANYGTIFLTIADKDKQDALPLVRRFYDQVFNIEATKGTAEFLRQHGIPAPVRAASWAKAVRRSSTRCARAM